MTYLNKLARSYEVSGTTLCMGIDPVVEALPGPDLPLRERIRSFYFRIFNIIEETGKIPGAFKPNIGFFHALDRPLEGKFEGSLALADILKRTRKDFPEIPVILDAKRGDIATSSKNYAAEAFDTWQADAVTVSPWLGKDGASPFWLYKEGTGIYLLVRTSNPGASDFQELATFGGPISGAAASEAIPLYHQAAKKLLEWSGEKGTIGAVVGATSPKGLEEACNLFSGKAVPLLIPGVGAQGGSPGEVIEVLKKTGYPIEYARINSSRGLCQPWGTGQKTPPRDWEELIRSRLIDLHEALGRRCRGKAVGR